MKTQKEGFESFKTWFSLFNAVSQKIKNRDKAQENFKHYYEKIHKLR